MKRLRLNPAQREAVDHDLGPLLVLAGAGSGKTGVVTQRIARLVASGVPASAILAMTFTNKAAAEMQERVARLAGERACKELLVCTFHRFGLQVLAREARALGLRGGRFAILDRGDSASLVRDALRPISSSRAWDVSAVLHRISLAKNAFVDSEAYAERARAQGDEYDEITAIAYPRYQSSLRSLQAFDFDDLVCEPVLLWRRQQDVLARWRQRFRYIIVDEYQDTNLAQLEMLRLLAAEHENLCVVGDDDQAIYAWRGADVRNILDFEQHFPGTRVVRLEQNYRSSQAILDVANAVLEASSARRHRKHLVPNRGTGNRVASVAAPDGTQEARFVAEEAFRLVDRGLARPSEIAVLYRSNLQAPEIESELRARGVPYQVFGGKETFEKKEVKDLLAYLAVAVDSANEIALRRAINYPPRGVGEAALGKLAAFATRHDRTLMHAVERAHAVAGLSAEAAEGCRDFVRLLTELGRGLDTSVPPHVLVANLAASLDLKRQLWAECGQNAKAAARRWGNVEALLKTFERRHQREPLSREGIIQFLRLLLMREQDADDGEPGNKVTLVTMHGAKGLEFSVVFVVGLEEGLMPHARSIEERVTDAAPVDGRPVDEIEQERRLFYVAVTRAREQLYLCHARARLARGKLVKRAPSRFVVQIPSALLESRDLAEAPAQDSKELVRGAKDVLAALEHSATGGRKPASLHKKAER